MLKTYIQKLLRGENLTTQETGNAIKQILQDANQSQVAAFLVLLRAKQETSDEILGIVEEMRTRMVSVSIKNPVLDIVGTGGDGANTVNISTGAAILAASCGVKVVKHGNRAISSLSGSADVLEALGVNINMNPTQVTECVEKVGIGFCFAPNFHPAMNALREVRRGLGVPTCFNILGPLLNPAKAQYLLLGVFQEELVSLVAGVIAKLNIERAIVFCGNGLDELSCIGPIKAIEITKDKQCSCVLDPTKYGFMQCCVDDLKGGSAQKNAVTLLEVFKGKKEAISDTLIFNAAVALYICGKAKSISQGVSLVKDSIENARPLKLLKNFRTLSNKGGK